MTRSSLQRSSILTYQRAWKLFDQFYLHISDTISYTLPISPHTLALFIAYMFDRRYAPATVNTYVSALGYSHKLFNLTDPTKVFFIMQMLKGYGKLGFRLDSRLPITLPILTRLLMAASQCITTTYDQCQFKATCALAFFAFLRIGELTSTSKQSPTPLNLNQLTKLLRDGEVIGFKISFTDYKHNYNQRPFSMAIYRQPTLKPCPVQLLCNYLTRRGNSPGPIFITPVGATVPRNMFISYLNQCLKFCNLNPTVYKSHSFRIGAASFAAEQGLSDAQIRVLGRWKSNAFHKYIRVSTLTAS